MKKISNSIELINHGNDVRVSTLEIARHILPGSKQKTIAGVNRDLVRIIKKYIDGFNELGKAGFDTHPIYRGGSTEYVLLNEPQTNLLFMSMRNSNPLVWQFKVALAKRFDEMRRLLIQRSNAEWIAYRNSGKIVTKRLNELFSQALNYAGKKQNDFRFKNLQQTIYKAALGKTCQQLRKERDIKKHHTIRDYLNPKELERISLLQTISELTLQQHENVTDSMILAALVNSGHMLTTAVNCPLIDKLA